MDSVSVEKLSVGGLAEDGLTWVLDVGEPLLQISVELDLLCHLLYFCKFFLRK